jgi:hypothetical protein
MSRRMRSWALSRIEPVCPRLENADGTAHLVAAILIEDGVNNPSVSALREFAVSSWTTTDKLSGAMHLTALDQPAIAGTKIVDRDDIGMGRERPVYLLFDHFRIIIGLDRTDDIQIWKLRLDDLGETGRPVHMVRQRHRSGHHEDLGRSALSKSVRSTRQRFDPRPCCRCRKNVLRREPGKSDTKRCDRQRGRQATGRPQP